MFNVCVRILNNIEEAEDVLQEAFLNAFLKLNSYRGDATFGAWLKRIMVNYSINYLKKNRRDIVEVDERTMEMVDVSHEDTTLPDGMTIDRVREAIQLLPDGYRIVFSLYLLEGYDHQEIAQILNISESASKSQYSRAKKKLRQILN